MQRKQIVAHSYWPLTADAPSQADVDPDVTMLQHLLLTNPLEVAQIMKTTCWAFKTASSCFRRPSFAGTISFEPKCWLIKRSGGYMFEPGFWTVSSSCKQLTRLRFMLISVVLEAFRLSGRRCDRLWATSENSAACWDAAVWITRQEAHFLFPHNKEGLNN